MQFEANRIGILTFLHLSWAAMEKTFVAKVERFEREMGWHYVSVPTELSNPLEYLADRGLIAIRATVGNSSWQTSMLPMGDGTHFIALPTKVRSKEKLLLGTEIEISFEPRTRENQQKNE
jgi:hypothetical protein